MNHTPEIAQLGAEVLRLQARPIDDFYNDKFLELIGVMQEMMLEANGVGIAAPQIGQSWQVVIVASRPTPRYPLAPEMAPLLMVNPELEIIDASLLKDWEGCLSVPGVRALVPRYQAIRVKFQDQLGQSRQVELSGFPARVFQHEFDHLQGLVYLDRVENNRDIVAESEFFKIIANQEQAA